MCSPSPYLPQFLVVNRTSRSLTLCVPGKMKSVPTDRESSKRRRIPEVSFDQMTRTPLHSAYPQNPPNGTRLRMSFGFFACFLKKKCAIATEKQTVKERRVPEKNLNKVVMESQPLNIQMPSHTLDSKE